MIWLNKEQIMYLHSEIINATGGDKAMRDEKLLESALLSPMQTYDLKELYPTTIDKAVRLAYCLTKNHPFIDGNKRIGVHAMLVTLKLNRITLSYTQEELSTLFLKLASGEENYEGLKDWVLKHNKTR